MASFNVWLVALRVGILKRSSLNTGVYEAFIIKSLGLSSCKFFFLTKQRNKSFLMGFHRKGKKKILYISYVILPRWELKHCIIYLKCFYLNGRHNNEIRRGQIHDNPEISPAKLKNIVLDLVRLPSGNSDFASYIYILYLCFYSFYSDL